MELSVFARKDAEQEHLGIAIYRTRKGAGYIFVSDQKFHVFLIYPREDSMENEYHHKLITPVSVSTIECKAAYATNLHLGELFPNGIPVALTKG